MKRIICVGNRHEPGDAAGPLVYDRLVDTRLPLDVEVIDGGLGGLDLLCFVEATQRVVFVDAVSGFEPPNGIIVLRADEAARDAPAIYGHEAGLAYLLRVLRRVCDDPIPEVFLVGIEGVPDDDVITAAVELSLSIAVEGFRVSHKPASQIVGVGP